MKDDAETELPDSAGVPEEIRGESGYFLPITQDQNLLWPGWDSLGLNGSKYETNSFTIEDVEGPGEIYLWSGGGLAGMESVLDDGGYKFPGTISQSSFAHVHANWFFTEPGAYYVTVKGEATAADGTSDETESKKYLFTVGEDLPEGYNNCDTEKKSVPNVDETPRDNGGEKAPEKPANPGNSGGDSNGSNAGLTGGNSGGGNSGTNVAPAGNGGGNATAQEVCIPLDEWNAQYGDGDASSDSAGGSSEAEGSSESGDDAGESGKSSSGEKVTANSGHFDLGPVVEGGSMKAKAKDDRSAPPVWRNPEDITFILGEKAKQDVSSAKDLDYIAKGSKEVYMIQSTQEDGIPWVGWNTQHESIVNGPGKDGATMTLKSVDGPGDLAVFLNGNMGQMLGQKVFDTVGGPKSYKIPANTHQHGNWVFTKPGTYKVTLEFSAGGQSSSGTYTFQVGSAGAASATDGASEQTAFFASVKTEKSDDAVMSSDDEPAGGEDTEGTENSEGAESEENTEESTDEAATSGNSNEGRTPSGKPCTLANTGFSESLLTGTGLGLVTLGTGGAMLYFARRQRAKQVATANAR